MAQAIACCTVSESAWFIESVFRHGDDAVSGDPSNFMTADSVVPLVFRLYWLACEEEAESAVLMSGLSMQSNEACSWLALRVLVQVEIACDRASECGVRKITMVCMAPFVACL